MKHHSKILWAVLTVSLWGQGALCATPLKFENIKGWRVETVANDIAFREIFKGSQYVFFVDDESAEEHPIIRARELKEAKGLDLTSPQNWQSTIFADKSQPQIVTAQKVLKSGDDVRYVAEFQTDTGTNTMLYSVVLAVVVDGKIQILTYEQRRDVYLKNIGPIKRLFENVKITATKE